MFTKSRRQQGHISVALLWMAAGASCAMAASLAVGSGMGYSHLSPSAERSAMLAVPLVETPTVTLSRQLIAEFERAGINQLHIEPIGNSRASFNIFVNGKVVPDSYSSVHNDQQMYRLKFSGSEARVWVAASLQESLGPQLIGHYLEREMEEFLRSQQK